MTNKNTLPITEARRQIFDIAEEVQRPGVYFTLTEKGRAKAVVMSADEYESWVETMAVMQEFPDISRDIAKVERDIKSGEYKNYITLDELLAKEGYVLADKGKKKYAIHSKAATKRRKIIK